jgi:hypothetical protein
MKRLINTLALAVICAVPLSMSTAAYAQAAQDGPTIGKMDNIDILATGVMNAATGLDSSTTQNIGSVESGKISELTNEKIVADGAMNAATGQGTCADQSIGTIGHKTACERNK